MKEKNENKWKVVDWEKTGSKNMEYNLENKCPLRLKPPENIQKK